MITWSIDILCSLCLFVWCVIITKNWKLLYKYVCKSYVIFIYTLIICFDFYNFYVTTHFPDYLNQWQCFIKIDMSHVSVGVMIFWDNLILNNSYFEKLRIYMERHISGTVSFLYLWYQTPQQTVVLSQMCQTTMKSQ